LKLTEALIENDVTSGREIMRAIDKYVAGDSPEDAASGDSTADFNYKALSIAITKGDWESVRQQLLPASPDDAHTIRNGLAGFLRYILLNSEGLDDSTEAVAKAILKLSVNTDGGVLFATISAICFELCRIFKRHSR
jgi:hypothetical protein